jgi:ribosomal protein L34E
MLDRNLEIHAVQPSKPLDCWVCGNPLSQLKRGRQRRYYSDGCRRRADTERKAALPRPAKPSECAICGRSIQQSPTGRPRTKMRTHATLPGV